MVRQGNKAPKLRGGAAVVRALVPFAVVLAESTLSNTDERERTMITAAKHLNDCYKHLSADEFHGLGLKENAIRFAGTYIALSQTSTDQKLWRVKPKMHLFLELCDGSVEPSKIWTYRDEDLGGECGCNVAQARRPVECCCLLHWCACTLQRLSANDSHLMCGGGCYLKKKKPPVEEVLHH